MINKKGMKATKVGFGEGVLEMAKLNESIIGLGADITSSVSMNFFAEQFPNRFFSFGIAEQNSIGVAAGLALSGKLPVFSTYGVFAAIRATDQIRVSLCYNDLHVIIGGAHAGISVGADGATHQALEDLAIMRAIPKMTVLSPCDATQTFKALEAAVNQAKGPVYIRFGREAVPDFTSKDLPFEIGKAQKLRDGDDICIVATGHMVWEALVAAVILEKEGINARVLNVHTIKPIDKEALISAANECGAIVTAEEHQISGGLGSAVAEVIVESTPVPIRMVAMPDCFGESGTPKELLEKYSLTSKSIVEKCTELLNGDLS